MNRRRAYWPRGPENDEPPTLTENEFEGSSGQTQFTKDFQQFSTAPAFRQPRGGVL